METGFKYGKGAIFKMNAKNSMNNGNEEIEEPRFLNPLIIKDIEDIAYPEKEGMEQDVKIWTPLSREPMEK